MSDQKGGKSQTLWHRVRERGGGAQWMSSENSELAARYDSIKGSKYRAGWVYRTKGKREERDRKTEKFYKREK